MSRIRTIKPEFWTSEQVMDCSRDARLLFIGLWSFCDDYGRIALKPRTMKVQIFAGDDDVTADMVLAHIDQLERAGLVERYEVEGSRYLAITGWSRHQKVDHPGKSSIPAKPHEPSRPYANHREVAPLVATTHEGSRGNTEPSPPFASPREESRALVPDRKGKERKERSSFEIIDSEDGGAGGRSSPPIGVEPIVDQQSEKGAIPQIAADPIQPANQPVADAAKRPGTTEPVEPQRPPTAPPPPMAKAGSKRPIAKREPTRAVNYIPPDFEPTEETMALAALLLGDNMEAARADLAAFKDHWASRADDRAQKTDWNAAFRNWVRKSAESGDRVRQLRLIKPGGLPPPRNAPVNGMAMVAEVLSDRLARGELGGPYYVGESARFAALADERGRDGVVSGGEGYPD